MTRALSPKWQAVEDRVVAALRDASGSLRTSEVAKLIGNIEFEFPCHCRCGHRHNRVIVRRAQGGDILRFLHRLRKQGRVECLQAPGRREFAWRWVGDIEVPDIVPPDWALTDGAAPGHLKPGPAKPVAP